MKHYIFLLIIGYLFFPSQLMANVSVRGNDVKETSCISVTPDNALSFSMDRADTITTSVLVRNNTSSDINYDIRVNYKRPASINWAQVESGIALPEKTDTLIMQYENESSLSYAFGLDSSQPLSLATKFKAGEKGFNISTAKIWFIGDYNSEGIIHAEIKAGGNSIENSSVLATGSLSFQTEKSNENGEMLTILLDKDAVIYPNEEFFLIITYPPGVSRPQGCVMNEEVLRQTGRYWFKQDKGWTDLHSLNNFSHCAWIMAVVETEIRTNAWLDFSSTDNYTIEKNGNSTLTLLLDGSIAIPGYQTAEVILTTYEPCYSETKIPVTLHLNEAPRFEEIVKEVTLKENEIEEIDIDISDPEGDVFSITPVLGTKIVSYSLSENRLKLKIAPLSGDIGNYYIKYKIADSKGAFRYLELTVNVVAENKYLECLFEEGFFIRNYIDPWEYNINSFFRYSTRETLLIFQIESGNENILTVEQINQSVFKINPVNEGETTLCITMTNLEGQNRSIYHLPVRVGLCKNTSSIIRQKWNNVLFVNNIDGNYLPDGYQWYKNSLPIKNAVKQYYSAGNNADDFLDFDASYYVRLVTQTGDTIYTCPLIPVYQHTDEGSIYPNPVSSGGVIHIDMPAGGLKNEIVTVEFIDYGGRIVKKDSFPGESGEIIVPQINGIYLLRITSINAQTTQTLYIK